METVTDVTSTLRAIGIVGGSIIPVLFLIQYSYIANWLRTPAGRSMVAMTICIWLCCAPLAIRLADADGPNRLAIVSAVGLACVPLVILYRMVAFERQRRRIRRRAQSAIDEATARLHRDLSQWQGPNSGPFSAV